MPLQHQDVLIGAHCSQGLWRKLNTNASACLQVYFFNGKEWKEDTAWTMQLDRAWDLSAVRDAAYEALTKVISSSCQG